MPPRALPTLRRIFQIRVPSHPSFGRFRRFLRRRERGPGTHPRPATPEGDGNSSQRSPPPSSTHSIRNLGQEPDFLDISAADTDVFEAADEYNSDRSYASTSGARVPSLSHPLSAISSESFPIRGWGDLPSSSSAVSSGIDTGTRHSFSAGGPSLFAVDPFSPSTSTSQAGPWIPPFLSDLPVPSTLGSSPLIFTDPPQWQIVDDSPLLTCPAAPRLGVRSLPPTPPTPQIPLTPPAHDDEPTNELDNYEATYQSSSSSGNSSYTTAPQCPSPHQEYESERVPEIFVPSTIITDYVKPSKLVINQDISLADMRSVLSAIRHTLQDLTIGSDGINTHPRPSTTEKIDLSHLISLKVERVEYSFLEELLSSVKVDSLTALDLRVGSPEATPHELNIKWSQLKDVILHDDFSPETLDEVMSSLHNVTRLEWSGTLARTSHNKHLYDLDSLQTLSVCSNEDGCSFFLQNLRSRTLHTLRLSHFSPVICDSEPHGLPVVKKLSIEHKIDVDQCLATLCFFPSLTAADFGIGGVTVTEEYGQFPVTRFARLESLNLHCVSAPIRPLLMVMPLSKLKSLQITFNLMAAGKHQSCSGLADCLRKEDIPLETLHLVDANLTREELRSCLETVGPTLVDYRVRQTRLQGDNLGL